MYDVSCSASHINIATFKSQYNNEGTMGELCCLATALCFLINESIDCDPTSKLSQ